METPEPPSASGDRSPGTPDCMSVRCTRARAYASDTAVFNNSTATNLLGNSEPIQISRQCTFCPEKKSIVLTQYLVWL